MLLNLYDLSPANDYLFPMGLGLHHSGLEIDGREYSYGDGGGIFEGPPKEAPGARFRCQIELGSFDGGSKELNQALDDLRSNGGFGSNGYHLVKRNCNHFCNALSYRLLKRPIPPYVNRLADIGNCCSCLLPAKLLENSPIGGEPGGGQAQSSFVVPTRASMNRGVGGGNTQAAAAATAIPAFSGKGHSLSGGHSSTASTATSGSSESEGLLSRFTRRKSPSQFSTTTTTSSSGSDDVVDRREKARKAALARLERYQLQQSDKQC